MKKSIIIAAVGLLVLAGCGQSYEESKRISRLQQREAARKDSAALKIAVMPTLDCLPLFVAEQESLLDTLHGGVRLKMFNAQMDCDTALQRGRVEGAMTDLVRALHTERMGVKLELTSVTNAHWQLVTNRNSRIRQLKQLDDKMVAMTRFSATDLLTDRVIDSVKLDGDRVFRVQLNDVKVRFQMLQNNEMDALWMPEPLATASRQLKHPVVYDTQKQDLQLGVMVFRQDELARKERRKQVDLFLKAYDKACDLINQNGVRHYRDLIVKKCMVKPQVADSLPTNIKYVHAQGPREQDIAIAKQWMK